MATLAQTFIPTISVIVTTVGPVYVTPETERQLEAVSPRWKRPDRRTREGRLIEQFLRDVEFIAMEEWLVGRELEVV